MSKANNYSILKDLYTNQELTHLGEEVEVKHMPDGSIEIYRLFDVIRPEDIKAARRKIRAQAAYDAVMADPVPVIEPPVF